MTAGTIGSWHASCSAGQGDPMTPNVQAAILSATTRQGRYGVVYLRAIAAQAGCGFKENDPDEDAIAVDCDIQMRAAPIRVQVKTTYIEDMFGTDDIVHYAKPHWIDSWRDSALPVYYLVVVVRQQSSDWIEYPATGTLLADTRAYWTRVDNHDFSSSTRIEIPRSNELGSTTMTQWNDDLLATLGLT
ncbi:DUF4365 domain-containing protein [Curtobacterium flaccumfaciens]|uniref:DUF4365 domain-containing protein n=1 Tax=Curtobacterium flaccumfaciens TaxID=2035 RepID=UPI000FFF42FE|nr:DUF4365 domain-containing protein [Curtobacterium flaccumfaciens]MCS0644978.1 DUF4365 domain-containing protein [Curtobacterium flaccumfaciens pv. flaccumfaciens]MCS6526734.1 DUF4365 domain-containing protein [Curtobacterium flaccumfaciens pv. flaccumfaciens]NUU12123.1 DUF4365 domain-containing protein [Curtobacterium flaccumfaciens]RXF83252.1 hypothetical protein CffCFBP3418_13555 [Curtobacterium flaccumfaciens pv. flaccumfaciens]